MAHVEVTLQKGITVGTNTYLTAVLREPNALDIVEATSESERVVMVPSGTDMDGQAVSLPKLVASPTMTALNVTLKQIVSIGPFQAPIDKVILAKLSAEDFHIIQRKAQELEGVASASDEVAQRGRTDSGSQGAA